MDTTFWMLWDLIAVCAIAYYIYRCARGGFARTVVNFIGYVASAVAAGILSTPLAQWLYDAVVRDAMRAVISRQVQSAIESGGAAAADMAAAVPGWVQNILGSAGAPGVLAEFDAAGAMEGVLETALAEPVITLLRSVIFFLLFGVFSMIARRIANAFTGVNHLPLIGTLNTFLGGALGVLQGALVLYIAAVAVRLFLIIAGEQTTFLNEATIEAGFIFRFFWRMSG